VQFSAGCPATFQPIAGPVSATKVPNLRIRQAAELLGVSDDTVRRWINRGHIDARPGAAVTSD